jgi:hypothetical protein
MTTRSNQRMQGKVTYLTLAVRATSTSRLRLVALRTGNQQAGRGSTAWAMAHLYLFNPAGHAPRLTTCVLWPFTRHGLCADRARQDVRL